jgi:hypothetical protein
MAQFGVNGGMVNFLKQNGVWPEGLEFPNAAEPATEQPAEERVEE